MAFILSTGNVISFAEAADVLAQDRRFFESNEGLDLTNGGEVEDMLVRSTDRIVLKLKASSWWRQYNNLTVSATLGSYDVPTPNKNKIQRRSDITELCVFHTLKEYLYPKYADFGVETSAEVQKIAYYNQKFETLWQELLASGDFYDDNESGTVSSDEKLIIPQIFRRTRGRRSTGLVR